MIRNKLIPVWPARGGQRGDEMVWSGVMLEAREGGPGHDAEKALESALERARRLKEGS